MPSSNQPTVYGVSAMFLVLTNTAVGIRIASQWRMSKHFYVDDWAIIIAVLLSNITAGVYIYSSANYGLGAHYSTVSTASLVDIWRTIWITAWIQGPLLLSVKVSLLFLYKRLFLVHQRWLKWAWWINLIYAILWAIACTLYYILQCLPVPYYWEREWLTSKSPPPYPIEGTCSQATALQIASLFILSLVSDIGILILPMFALRGLKLPFKKQLGLAVVFGFGGLACVCEIIRIWLEATDDARIKGDPTYDIIPFLLINLAEPSIAIIAACMPLIASQLHWAYDKINSRRSSARGSRSSSSVIYTIKSVARIASLPKMRQRSSAARLPARQSFERLYRNGGDGAMTAKADTGGQGKTPVEDMGVEQIGVRRDIDVELRDVNSKHESYVSHK